LTDLTSPPTQYRLSGRRFYRSKDPTNSIEVLKEKSKENEVLGLLNFDVICDIDIDVRFVLRRIRFQEAKSLLSYTLPVIQRLGHVLKTFGQFRPSELRLKQILLRPLVTTIPTQLLCFKKAAHIGYA